MTLYPVLIALQQRLIVMSLVVRRHRPSLSLSLSRMLLLRFPFVLWKWDTGIDDDDDDKHAHHLQKVLFCRRSVGEFPSNHPY